MRISDQQEWCNQTFKDIIEAQSDFTNFAFEDCGFESCDFLGGRWNNASFTNCVFRHCNPL
jgi:uncharacterized protein YjbI with pentapeptide repeats